MGARAESRIEPAAGWVFLPAAGALVLHAPVLRFDLLRGLKRPIDGGLELGGRRLLGDNKTWRGAVVMFAGAVATTAALGRTRWFRERLPAGLAAAPAPAYGALLGLGLVGGELPTSFVKRRLGVAPGQRAATWLRVPLAVYDQGDVVVVGALALRPLWRPSRGELAGAFLTVSAVHLVFNLAGYLIGARETAL
ncbi:MAG TPA: CDP-archaeol synthase [Thermoleophilaceae bacterium]